jgi:large subunit ribosomal protein L30
MAYAVIRIRGTVNVNRKIEDTMNMLNLTRVNHCVILPENNIMKGMLDKAKDYITWGEVSEQNLARLIKFKGRLIGDKPIDDNYIMENSEFTSIMSISKGISNNEFGYKDLKNVKPIFRLSPPRKGYEGIKRSYRNGGALGYRGEDINDLLERML